MSYLFDRFNKWVYPALWSFIIFTGSAIPGPVLDRYPVISPLSNSLHVFEFLVLSLLIIYASSKEKTFAPGTAIFISIAFGIAFGASLEYMQNFIPGRFASIYDVAADGFGAALGIPLYNIIKNETILIKSKHIYSPRAK